MNFGQGGDRRALASGVVFVPHNVGKFTKPSGHSRDKDTGSLCPEIVFYSVYLGQIYNYFCLNNRFELNLYEIFCTILKYETFEKKKNWD